MDFVFAKKKEAVAIDIGSSSIKLVEMRSTKKGWELLKLGLAPLPPEAIVDGSIIDSMTVASTISALVKEHRVKLKDAVSALTGHSVIIKKVSLPAMTEEELGESIQWEAEQYIPFPMSDVNIDFQILGENPEAKGQMEVMLVAVKKDVINDYTGVMKEAGLNPVVIDVDCFALENMLEMNYAFAPNENVAIVNIGASIMSISIVSAGITVFARSTPLGGNLYTEEIQRRFNISFKEAEELKLGRGKAAIDAAEFGSTIDNVSRNLSMEVKKVLDFFFGASPAAIIGKVMLSGGAVKTRGFVDTTRERLGLPVELANPFAGVIYNPKNFKPEYLAEAAPLFAVGVGLSTRRLGDR
jgi:type IV pilus assembly protein PilM